ncbi:DNA ligase [Shewanella waksmanii]|uniref:DNA ligase n=1 Tax=Shewanella waksmanii TaxID=213783 RepID=UPI0037367626
MIDKSSLTADANFISAKPQCFVKPWLVLVQKSVAILNHWLGLPIVFLVLLWPVTATSNGASERFQYTSIQVQQFAGRKAQDIRLDEYLVSEKYDGVRTHWNGMQLITRQGNPIAVPESIAQTLPAFSFDAELWLDYGKFDTASAIARTQVVDLNQWQHLKLMIFDTSAMPGSFAERIEWAKLNFSGKHPHLYVIRQQRFSDWQQLTDEFNRVLNAGGEGLMMHRADAKYRLNNKLDLIKIKPYFDTEAIVIDYQMGYGGNPDLIKSLLVELDSGKRFKLASGFTLAQRKSPPPIGSLVTFKYYGVTSSGIPRHASFLRQR